MGVGRGAGGGQGFLHTTTPMQMIIDGGEPDSSFLSFISLSLPFLPPSLHSSTPKKGVTLKSKSFVMMRRRATTPPASSRRASVFSLHRTHARPLPAQVLRPKDVLPHLTVYFSLFSFYLLFPSFFPPSSSSLPSLIVIIFFPHLAPFFCITPHPTAHTHPLQGLARHSSSQYDAPLPNTRTPPRPVCV